MMKMYKGQPPRTVTPPTLSTPRPPTPRPTPVGLQTLQVPFELDVALSTRRRDLQFSFNPQPRTRAASPQNVNTVELDMQGVVQDFYVQTLARALPEDFIDLLLETVDFDDSQPWGIRVRYQAAVQV